MTSGRNHHGHNNELQHEFWESSYARSMARAYWSRGKDHLIIVTSMILATPDTREEVNHSYHTQDEVEARGDFISLLSRNEPEKVLRNIQI